MATGVSGHTSTGYTVDELACAIGRFLDDPAGMNVALVGVGQLGRSILGYFHGRRDNLPIVAGFDIDPWKYDRRIRGVPCYHLDQLGEVVRRQAIRIGILATPDPAAQPAADALIAAGVQGLLNFTPVALNVPEHVYVEVNDITASLERVAFFARRRKHSTTKALTP
jgi:redox-sensing transcriptional repressor